MKDFQSIGCSHVSGGFLICRPFEKPDVEDDDLLPESVTTVCRCLADILPADWAIDWVVYEEKVRRQKAKEFGLSPHAMVKVIEDVTVGFNENKIGWPGIFYSLDSARRFASKHLKVAADAGLLGIGLHEDLVGRFLSSDDTADHKGKYGIYDTVAAGEKLPDGGKILGYEILGYDHGDFHSWLCNGLEEEADRELAVKPNRYGLLDSFDDAVKVADYVGQDDVGAEPGIWMPWLLVKY